MKKYILIISLFLFLPVQNSPGQDAGIKLYLGAGSVRMEEMKYLQEFILSTYPVEGKITSSFPPFSAFSVLVFKQLFEQIRIGGGYSFSTTGGKSSYSDYSGSLITEMAATSHRLGAYLSYSVWGGELLDLSLYGKAEACMSDLFIQSNYTIASYTNILQNKYRAISPAGTVGAELSFRIKSYALGLSAAYLVDLTGELKEKEEGNPLLDPNDFERTLHSDWTGWQLQFSVQIPFRF